MIERANPPGVHEPQAAYSHVVRDGQLLYISGQLGLALDGTLVGPGDAKAQATQAWHNIVAILSAYNSDLDHLIKMTTYITHWAYRPLVAEARTEFFPSGPYPANTLVVVAGLADPSFLVEIEATARIP